MGRREVKGSDPEVEFLSRKIAKKLGEPTFNTFFLSPVKEGYIKYCDLINGGLTLFDLEQMNEAISYYAQVNKIIHEKDDGSKIRGLPSKHNNRGR